MVVDPAGEALKICFPTIENWVHTKLTIRYLWQGNTINRLNNNLVKRHRPNISKSAKENV